MKPAGMTCDDVMQSLLRTEPQSRRSPRAFAMTDTELNVIAARASIGFTKKGIEHAGYVEPKHRVAPVAATIPICSAQ